MLLTLLVAAGLRVQRDRAQLQAALVAGLAIAGAALRRLLRAAEPVRAAQPSEARGQISGQSAQADTAKLGQDDTYGWLYYLGTLAWGFGWLPLLAAVAGARASALRRDWRHALLLVAFPVFLYLYLGGQGRFFGRWLLPIYPALCVLAGYAVVRRRRAAARAASGARRRRARRAAVRAGRARERPRRPRCSGRKDTRDQALRWIDANVPAGARGRGRAVRPGVLARRARPARLARSSARSRPTRSACACARSTATASAGYCWVVVGSTQKERGLKAGLRSSRNYYRGARRGERARRSRSRRTPTAPTRCEFSYDSSFNYRPRAYERPGPVVEIHRLRDCTPAVG